MVIDHRHTVDDHASHPPTYLYFLLSVSQSDEIR